MSRRSAKKCALFFAFSDPIVVDLTAELFYPMTSHAQNATGTVLDGREEVSFEATDSTSETAEDYSQSVTRVPLK